ncbi:MAG: tetratricopeptide repeat protein [Candidatus Poribacteria bacterium]|nr:tetratricopeptide repeat protein [Candidatus Poribacteria bacterium]
MPSFEQLTQILTDADQISIFRRDAAADLGDLGDASAIPILIGALEDASALVRREAARSLGKLNAPKAASPLLLALAHEIDEATRRIIVEALGRIGTREAIPALAGMYASKSLLTRAEAQKSIRQILQRHPDILEPDMEPDEPTAQIPHAPTPPAGGPYDHLIDVPSSPALPADDSADMEAVAAESEPLALSPPAPQSKDIQIQALPSQPTPTLRPQVRQRRYGLYIIFLVPLLAVAVTAGIFYLQRPQIKSPSPVQAALSRRATIYLEKGDTHFQRGDYENAIIQYEQAQSVHPDSLDKHLDPHRNLGFAYLQQGRYTLAAKAFQRVVEHRPDDATAYNHLGTAYMQQGQYQFARDAYRRALEIRVDFAEAYNNLALLYANGPAKQFGQAEILARKAIQLGPNEAPYYDTLGWVLYKQGRINRSIEALEKAIQLRHDLVDAHYHLALAAYKANQRDRALQEIRTVFQLEPNFSAPPNSSPDSTFLQLIRRMPGIE